MSAVALLVATLAAAPLHVDIASAPGGDGSAERPFTRIPVAVLGRANAKVQPAEIDVRLSCPPEIVRALRPEQIVPRVQVSPAGSAAGDHGSDVLPVQLTIDQCEVHLTPASVVVHW